MRFKWLEPIEDFGACIAILEFFGRSVGKLGVVEQQLEFE